MPNHQTTATLMPIRLPRQPAGGIPLPPQPQDPPTLADVFSALAYQRAVEASYSQPNYIPTKSPDQSCADLSELQANSPSSNDTARAEVYKTEVIMAHSPGGFLVLISCRSLTTIESCRTCLVHTGYYSGEDTACPSKYAWLSSHTHI